jgi:hypothetical protein
MQKTKAYVTSGSASIGAFLSSPLRNAVDTKGQLEQPTTRDYRQYVSRRAWDEFIDRTLIEWGWDSSRLEDEGIEPPKRETISRAIHLAQNYRDQGLSAPDSIVPDPNGGVVFERRTGDISEVLHFWDDGSVEYFRFQGHRLLERKNIAVE